MLFRHFANHSHTHKPSTDRFLNSLDDDDDLDFDIEPLRVIRTNQRWYDDNPPQLKPKKRIKIPIFGRVEVPESPPGFDDKELSAALELSKKTEKEEREQREQRERAEKEKKKENKIEDDEEESLAQRKRAFREQLFRECGISYKDKNSKEIEKLANESYLEWEEEALLKKKIEAFGFRQVNIEGDGNCQFRALADQLFEDPQRYSEVRKEICHWLKKNESFKIGSAQLKDFCPSSKGWSKYCKEMEKDKTWGDHITLFAAAQMWKVQIFILSSFIPSNQTEFEPIPDITITPELPEGEEVQSFLYLVHWHERHYSSLRMKE